MATRLDRRALLKLGGLAVGGAAVAVGTPGEALAHDFSSFMLLSSGGRLSVAQALARAARLAARARQLQPPDLSFQVLTRRAGQPPESATEKAVIVLAANDRDPVRHAWADARFATDIMAEHALFMAMLIPPGTGETEQAQAVSFADGFLTLNQQISSMTPPARGELRVFVANVVEPMKPFIDFKAHIADAQRTGRLRSLIWPLFADHIRNEAERWSRRLTQLASGQSELDRTEVVSFWTKIMEEHARFVAHLLDPEEFAPIDQAMELSKTARDLLANPTPALQEPGLATVMRVGQEVIDFKTAAARGIETAQIQSIIDPRLADHVRREAVKFADELKRVV
jgi:Domain of unknown function (DUF2935)